MTDTRLDPVALTPPVPWEMRDYLRADSAAAETGVLAVGKPGKVGVLDIELAVGERSGRTGLRRRFVKAPMSLSRPLHIDPSDPAHAVVYVRSTGGGLAENDRVRQRILLRQGARATVTTQAATNVHRMNAGCGSQWVSAVVEDSAALEYLPGHTTVYGGARLLQLTEFDVAPGGCLIAADMLLLGRLARGEVHRYGALAVTQRITRAGRVVLSDRTVAVGSADNTHSQMFGDQPVWANLVALPPETAGSRSEMEALMGELRKVEPRTQVRLGATTLVGGAGVMVRLAGQSPEQVRRTLTACHDIVRQRILDKPGFDLRRM